MIFSNKFGFILEQSFSYPYLDVHLNKGDVLGVQEPHRDDVRMAVGQFHLKMKKLTNDSMLRLGTLKVVFLVVCDPSMNEL
jgi:hypothetical protein